MQSVPLVERRREAAAAEQEEAEEAGGSISVIKAIVEQEIIALEVSKEGGGEVKWVSLL